MRNGMDKNFSSDDMSYEYLQNLRSYNPTWKLLTATRASLIISFLYATFVRDNKRELPEYQLINSWDSHMEQSNIPLDDRVPAKELLTQCADDDFGWLRKFYPANSDEVHYDLTSSAQKAIEWVQSLKAQSFVGTESRLLLVFQLFHQIVEQSDEDPEWRIQELERRKGEIDEEIARVQQGNVKVLDSVQIKERYLQAMQISREILADFRSVEQNFRDLRQEMQGKITSWDKGKGELLKDFFQNQSGIQQSEQGKSFQGFFDFLMSHAAQDDFEQTIRSVGELDAVKTLAGSKNAYHIIREWVNGSKHVQDTLVVVSEQLRRYVDENFLQEERRINQIIKEIETAAVHIRNDIPRDMFMDMDGTNSEITLPFDRPLFSPPVPSKIEEPTLVYGDVQEDDGCALYTHISVDKKLIESQIDQILQTKPIVSLAQIIETYPLKMGLAELMAYLSLAYEKKNTLLQTEIQEPIMWKEIDGTIYKANFCRVIYSRDIEE